MKTVVLEVRSLREALDDSTRAMKTGRAERESRISFASPELLWQVLTAKRWGLLKAMCGAGPISIREAARRVGREHHLIVGVADRDLEQDARSGHDVAQPFSQVGIVSERVLDR